MPFLQGVAACVLCTSVISHINPGNITLRKDAATSRRHLLRGEQAGMFIVNTSFSCLR